MEKIGYKTEDGYTILFNAKGELTDGDMIWPSESDFLKAIEAGWFDATPIYNRN